MPQNTTPKNGPQVAPQQADPQKPEEKVWRAKRPFKNKQHLLRALKKNPKIKQAIVFLFGERKFAYRIDPNGSPQNWERFRFTTPANSSNRVGFAIRQAAA